MNSVPSAKTFVHFVDRLPQWRRFSGIQLVSALIAATVALSFCILVNSCWEDYFITFKFSENLCAGNGLVYHPGVRVHGFTSPLGVLLPALSLWVTGGQGYLAALWLYRAICIPFYAACLAVLLPRVPEKYPLSCLVLAFLFLADVKAVAFSTNGMETGLMLFFTAMAFRDTIAVNDRQWCRTGAVWAGLMWTRPDSCIYIAVFGIVSLLYSTESRKACFLYLVKAALVTTVLYLPWFSWAWWYYGSPIPNTVLAKAHSSFTTPLNIADLVPRFFARTGWVFEPVYAHSYGWPPVITWSCRFLALFASFLWLWRSAGRACRVSSLCFLLLNGYTIYMPYAYPWYYPPIALLGYFSFASALVAVRRLPGRQKAFPRLIAAVLFPLAAVWLFMAVCGWRQLALYQKLVDAGNRRRVGEWLGAHVQKGERVYVECLGYIGYFSRCHMLDYPGLCSPEVSSLSNVEQGFISVAVELKPEWLVLRPHEVEWMKCTPYICEHYRLKQVFCVHSAIDACGYVPGENMLRYDALFGVYQHVDCPIQAPVFEGDAGGSVSAAARERQSSFPRPD